MGIIETEMDIFVYLVDKGKKEKAQPCNTATCEKSLEKL